MRVTSPADVGQVIRECRRERGLSQRKLADLVGVSRQWIVAVEAGKPRAEIGLLFRVLNALDLSLRLEPRPAESVDLDELLARGERS